MPKDADLATWQLGYIVMTPAAWQLLPSASQPDGAPVYVQNKHRKALVRRGLMAHPSPCPHIVAC